MTRRPTLGAALALALGACGGSTPAFDAPLVLGGVSVPADVLNAGHTLFDRYCATCHGLDGRADTPAARQLEPRPRDFAAAEFKYAAAGAGALPTDADLESTIRSGVAGTGMPPWPNLSATDVHAIVQYLKTFSRRWRSAAGNLAPAPQTELPARDAADSVPAGQSWQGDATPPPRTRLALRAAGVMPVARGER